MKKIIVRIENHWRVWPTTRRHLIGITLLGITLFSVRVSRKYIGVEIFNLDIIAHADEQNTESS